MSRHQSRGHRDAPGLQTDDVYALRGWVIRADDDRATLDVGTQDRKGIGMARAREGVKIGVISHSQ
jgi:hypothetical protein